MSAFEMWFAVLIAWLGRQEQDALAYLMEENRILRPLALLIGWAAPRNGVLPVNLKAVRLFSARPSTRFARKSRRDP